MSNQKFLTKDNMLYIIGIFTSFMQDKHNVVFEKDREINELKRTIHSIMVAVKQSNTTGDINQLNMQVLTKIKEVYVHELGKNINETQTKKPNVENLERDYNIYGNRDLPFNNIIPQKDPYQKRENNRLLDNYITERESITRKELPDMSIFPKNIIETPENQDDFLYKVKILEEERLKVRPPVVKKDDFIENTANDSNELCLITREDNTDPYSISSFATLPKNNTNSTNMSNTDNILSLRQSTLIPLPKNSKIIPQYKYLSVNSADRNWKTNIERYSYSVGFNSSSIQGNYKNIRSLSVGKVIIPDEIRENVNIVNYPSKTQFNYEFSFSYPYLILRIDEFNDIYDGTNDDVRRCFAQLVYYQHYKAPNGRGYVILKPMQKEKKVFYPSPLSSLSKLTISLLKPNGQLLNDSSDPYKVFKLDYEPFNPLYYKVVTDTYFDKNEFFVGDVVVFSGFEIVNPLSSTEANSLNIFMNRSEGHEITQIGSTNTNGYFRSFYIKALGQFDKVQGSYVVDQNVVNCLNDYNNTINYNTFTGTNGYILNYSLQNNIALTIETLINDSSSDQMSLL